MDSLLQPNSHQSPTEPLESSNSQSKSPGFTPSAHSKKASLKDNQMIPLLDDNRKSFSDTEEMKEFDLKFSTCYLKCYKIWLWLLIIGSFIGTWKNSMVLIYNDQSSGETIFDKFYSFAYCLWTFVQSLFAILAIYQRNLTNAMIAWWMMALYMIVCVILVLRVIGVIIGFDSSLEESEISGYVYIMMCGVLFVVAMNLLVHVCMNMIGAFKVKKILLEREIQKEMAKKENEEESRPEEVI